MLLGRLRIRGKLALLLIPPLLGMIALTVPVIIGRVQVADRASDTAQTARLAGQVGSLIQELQQERLLSVGYLIYAATRSRLVLQSAAVTDKIADLRASESPLPAEVRAALDALPPLATVRADVLIRQASPLDVLTAFGNEVTRLINSLRLTHKADTTTSEGQQILALDSVLRADEGVSVVAPYILIMAATKELKLATPFAVIYSTLLNDVAKFRLYATPEQRGLYDLVQKASDARTGAQFLTGFAADPGATIGRLDARVLFPTVESLMTLGRFIESKIIADVVADVTQRQQRALTEAYVVGALCLLVLLIVMLLSVAVARAVARPLTHLTRSADRVAQVTEAELVKVADGEIDAGAPIRLDPVDTSGRDEVGDLARAFDRVQGTAARLVERQVVSRQNVAQMFGHVGRRTQNLVGRQLTLIDRLERQEADPTRLQHLYQLDHISSRLRRSASSLVVLSGSAGADSHVAPLPLADVVRLALGEIEDYTRVDVRVPTDIALAPAVIGDLVLALAELMENATTFSPPNTRVTVTAVVTGPGVRLLVVDHGLGMTAERMADENGRLAHRERLDLVPTEVLGLFVVGRLARRHGLRVILTPSPGGGVTAEVEVPERLLVVDVTEPRVVAVARARVGTPESVIAPPPRALAGVAPTAPPAPASPAAPAEPVAAPTAAPAAPAAPVRPAPEWPIRRRTSAAPPPSVEEQVVEPRIVEQPLVDQPAAEGRVVEGQVVDENGDPTGPAYDEAAFSRAKQMIGAGQPWNAFVPQPRTTPENAGGRNGANERPVKEPSGLRQRVPGAQLPPRGGRRTLPRPSVPDPAEARALIEQFEAGVKHAERHVRAATPGGGTATAASAAPPATAAPTATAATAAPTVTAATAQPVVTPAPAPVPAAVPANATQAPLRRRQPGATLEATPQTAEPSATELPLDADEARQLVQEFEAGVARAMRKIGAGLRDEEESPR